jgi:SH3 domain protein
MKGYLTMKKYAQFLTLAASLLAMDFATAQTAYIRDTLYVPLRSGQSNAYRIVHKGLKTGSVLQVLEVSEDKNYTRVKTSKGIEGWLQSQYLSYEPVASIKLARAEANVAKLTTANQQLTKEKNELTAQLQTTSSKAGGLDKQNSALSKELNEIKTIAGNALKLNEDNIRLTEDNQLLKTRIDLLEAENLRLQEDKTRDEWLTGATIAFVFALLGWFLSTRKSKKTGWGNSGL